MGAVLALLVALHAPGLGWGFFADDWGQRLALENPEAFETIRPWNLYDFGVAPGPGDPLFEEGVFPWWTDPGWKARFFRPVSSAVLRFDAFLFGRYAPAHHLMGLLWHGTFLFLAWRLFRAAGVGEGVALLALAWIGCEDGAAITVGWIANRNAVVEGVFTAAALLFALRARRGGRLGPGLAALLCAAPAAGSKESGIAAALGCALLFLWPLPREAYGERRRGLGLASLGVAVAHVGFLLLAGYGARCRFYPMPWTDPGAWLTNLAGLLAAGPISSVGPFPVDGLLLVPGGYWPLVLGCALLVLAVSRAWFRAMRSFPLGPPLAGFALAAVLPQAGAPPSDRLFYVAALGLGPVTATLAARLRGGSGRWGRRGAWVLGLSALPLSALMLVWRGNLMGAVSRDLSRAFEEAELDPRPPARRDVFFLQCPSVLAGLSPLAGWRFLRDEPNTRFHPLQFGRRGLVWTRSDARTFELESLDEPFLSSLFEGVFLTRSLPPVGARLRSFPFEVEVLEESPPRRIRVTCDEPLEAERFVFLAWSEGRWRRVAPPAIGGALELATCAPLAPGVP